MTREPNKRGMPLSLSSYSTQDQESSEKRFWGYVRLSSESNCWTWTKKLNPKGYGVFRVGRDRVKAHRYSWSLNRGDIPSGMVIDHLCENKACVNPSHLNLCTQRVHLLRYSDTRCGFRKSHCIHGHPLSGDNLVLGVRGHRLCRECRRLYRLKWRKEHGK